MIGKDDWRLMGQEKFLMGRELSFINNYEPRSEEWEHEHCAFCMAKISPYEGDLHKGYCTADEKRMNWICETCFEDFKDLFKWSIVDIKQLRP